MAQELWTLVLLLALLNPQLHIFQDWLKVNRALENENYNSMQMKTTHSPVPVLEIYFSLTHDGEIPPTKSSRKTNKKTT